MPVTAAEVVAEARRHLGKKWVHQGRGETVDCLGFLVLVAGNLGLRTADRRNYDRMPDGTLLPALREVLTEVPIASMRVADLIVMGYDKGPSHIGLIGDYPARGHFSVIHASNARRAVIEHRLDSATLSRIVAVFRSDEVTS